jgi:alkanesulfonate monooxygenase SsuD/methylene tetrahydromethanopterin reductase-like flavin-dependent oxidoreductase (luciferase family)
MGLPYVFAAHFAPAQFRSAIAIYRANFKPSKQLAQPYVMACVNVIAAETDQAAELQATSLIRLFIGIITNTRKPLQPPAALPASYQITEVRETINSMLACTFIGSRETIQKSLTTFIAETEIDELMAATYIYDRATKLKSFSILYDALNVE